MNILCVIPARINSSRLPKKALSKIGHKPMVQMTYEKACQCPDFAKVVVATDSDEIASVIQAIDGHVEMTAADIKTGSDRVAVVAERYANMDVIVNLQGDEPFIKPDMLSTLVKPFVEDSSVLMATLGSPLDFDKEYTDPNIVKAIYDNNGDAIYFSRAPIPHFRHAEVTVPVLHHMGVYAFKREFLLRYTQLPQMPLELAESLEQLRAIEHGYKIRISKVTQATLEINTPEELAQAQQRILDEN